MNESHREFKLKVQACYDLIPALPYAPFVSKKKRSLLPFVGGILSSLFGTASEADLNLLRRQIFQSANATVFLQNVVRHDAQRLSSFMSLAQARFNNLEQMVQDQFYALNQTLFRQSFLRTEFNAQILRVMAIAFEKFTHYLHLHDTITQIFNGLEILKMGSLPSNLFTAEILTTTLHNISAELKSRVPMFQLLHMDANYYYKNADFICTRFRNKIYVTIKFPISNIAPGFKIYDVIKYPLQFPNNSSFINELTTVSKYFIISDNREFYIETDELSWPIETFKITSLKPVSQASCLLSLYLDDSSSIHKLCQYTVFVDDRKPALLMIDYPLILIRHTPVFNISCPSRLIELTGCSYCFFSILCGCTVLTVHTIIPARISDCKPDVLKQPITPILQYNYNLPLLQHFFDNKSLESLSQQDLLHSPLSVQLPSFRLFNHSLQERLASSNRLNFAMDRIVNATKSDQMIFATALDPVLTGDIDFLGNYFQSIPGYITLASTALSGVSFLVMLWLLYKIHILYGSVAFLTNRNVLSASLSIKPFIYVNPTSTSLPFVIKQEHLQSINPFLVFIVAMSILYFFYKLRVWRKAQPVVKARCKLFLHVEQSCTNLCINIHLQSLPYCPTQYTINSLHMPLCMRVTGFCRPFLIIDPLPFSITHANSLANVNLCSEVPISFFTLWKLRSLMKKGYGLYLFLEHGGMVYYSKKLRAGNCLV